MAQIYSRRGYVLVVVLALLTLSSTLLVGVGRLAVNRALAARQARQELQRRWGVASCRAAILPFAEEILTRAGRAQLAAVPALRQGVRLGDQSFETVLYDEQAKANVNSLIDDASASIVQDRLLAGLGGAGIVNDVRLRSSYLVSREAAPGPASRPLGPRPWITGLGQIFDDTPPERLLRAPAGANSAPIDRITCWGDGAINLMRARAPALQLALAPLLTQLEVDRIVQVRDAMLMMTRPSTSVPPGSADIVTRILTEARPNPQTRAKLALTAHSACHSLWVVARDRQRSWYWLFVQDESNPRQPRRHAFVW